MSIQTPGHGIDQYRGHLSVQTIREYIASRYVPYDVAAQERYLDSSLRVIDPELLDRMKPVQIRWTLGLMTGALAGTTAVDAFDSFMAQAEGIEPGLTDRELVALFESTVMSVICGVPDESAKRVAPPIPTRIAAA